MTHLLDEATRAAGLALLSKDYAALNDVIYEVHLNPFSGYTRVPKLVTNVIEAFGDSLFLNQAKVFFELANQIEPTVDTLIGLDVVFFIHNELLSGKVYNGLEPFLDYLLTDKYGLFLSHRAVAAVLITHEGLDLKYGLIPSQQDAKEFILKTIDLDLPSILVKKAIERFDELSSSMYYDYLNNLRHALMHSTAYDLFKDMPKQILDYALNVKVKDDVCVLWIEDLIKALESRNVDGHQIYISHEEEMIARAYTSIPPLIVYTLDNAGNKEEHFYNVSITTAYRLSLITLHPVLNNWFQEIKNM